MIHSHSIATFINKFLINQADGGIMMQSTKTLIIAILFCALLAVAGCVRSSNIISAKVLVEEKPEAELQESAPAVQEKTETPVVKENKEPAVEKKNESFVEKKQEETNTTKEPAQANNESISEVPEEKISGNVTVNFYDVGLGNSVEIVTAKYKHILIDGGSKTAGGKIAQYLIKQKIPAVQYVISTNPADEHVGGLAPIAYNFQGSNVLASSKTSDSGPYLNFYKYVTYYDNKINYINETENLGVDSINLKMMPFDGQIVIKATYEDTSFLFASDCDDSCIGDAKDLKADVLLVPSHGSSSAIAKLVDSVDPKVAIISGTLDTIRPDVIKLLEDKGITVYRTDYDGTVTFKTDGKDLDSETRPELRFS